VFSLIFSHLIPSALFQHLRPWKKTEHPLIENIASLFIDFDVISAVAEGEQIEIGLFG